MIGVYNAMDKIIWSIFFIEASRYNISHNTLMKYNKISIRLENNGKFSRSKQAKHVNTRHLFVIYRVAHSDLEIEYCTVESMWSNIMTKPLQDIAFRESRAELMN